MATFRQAWAQAVRVDGTIIILHSGNHELICVRHRKTQTLYVSDLIEPPTCRDPGYGKIQVGIYEAAIQDMMDRTKQRLQRSQPKSPDGDDGDNPAGGSGDKDDLDGDWGPGSGHKGDQGNSKGRKGGSGGNPSGGVHKSSRFSKAEQEENILVSTNWSLLRYVCLSLVSIRISLTINNGKQSKQPANVICSCSNSNMVFMTPQFPPRSFVRLLRLSRMQKFRLFPCPQELYVLIHSMNACPLF